MRSSPFWTAKFRIYVSKMNEKATEPSMTELCEIFRERERHIFGNETPLATINEREISHSQTYGQAERLSKKASDSENQHQKRNAQQIRRITKQPVVHGNAAVHRKARGTRYSMVKPQISKQSTNQCQQTKSRRNSRITKQHVAHGKVAQQRNSEGTRNQPYSLKFRHNVPTKTNTQTSSTPGG